MNKIALPLKILKQTNLSSLSSISCQKVYYSSALSKTDTKQKTDENQYKNAENNTSTKTPKKLMEFDHHQKITELSTPLNEQAPVKKTRGSQIHLKEENVAKQFASMIIDDLKKDPEAVIVEVHPASGYLTEELLRRGISSIQLYENDPKFLIKDGPLDRLLKKYPGRLILYRGYFFYLWMLNYSEKFRESIIRNRCLRQWHEEPTMKIIAVATNIHFIIEYIFSILRENYFIKYGRSKLHLAIKPSIWIKLTASNESIAVYRYKSIVFQLLFDYKYIGYLDRKLFSPPHKEKKYFSKSAYEKMEQLDKLYMYVVEIEPKPDIFSKYNIDELYIFWYFVRQHTFSRNFKVIKELERYAPGVGVQLISMGYNIFTTFGELTPQEIMNVFQMFISSPYFDKDSYMYYITEHVDLKEKDEEHEELTDIVTENVTKD